MVLKILKGAGMMAYVVEHLTSKLEALNSNSSAFKSGGRGLARGH
jgi:hypothetical protein